MPEISTVAIITAKPEGAEQVAAELTKLADATHAEAGCLHYSLHRGLEDPNTFVTIEKWDSAESLQQHLASDHIAAALGATSELLTVPPQIVPAAPMAVGDPAKGTF